MTHLIKQFSTQKSPQLLDSLKQLSFYAGCYGKSHWSLPEEVIDAKVASLPLHAATILVLSGKIHDIDTTEGIALWSNLFKGCFSLDAVIATI